MKVKIKKSLLKECIQQVMTQQDQMGVGDKEAKLEMAADQSWDRIFKIANKYGLDRVNIIKHLQNIHGAIPNHWQIDGQIG